MKRFMTKALCLLCAGALALTAAGCSKSGASSSAASSEAVSVYGSASDYDYQNFAYSDGLDENGYWSGIKALDYVTLPEDYAAIPLKKADIEPTEEDIQSQIDETFRTAYAALQKANMEIGIAFVDQISHTVPVEDSIRIKTRSVMGTEIPLVEYDKKAGNTPTYAYYSTKLSLDEAKAAFERVKELSIQLSMIENAAIRLATNIKKTQKRANALKNITIPRYETLTRDITNALEEKEREEFTRLKVIKRMKQNS